MYEMVRALFQQVLRWLEGFPVPGVSWLWPGDKPKTPRSTGEHGIYSDLLPNDQVPHPLSKRTLFIFLEKKEDETSHISAAYFHWKCTEAELQKSVSPSKYQPIYGEEHAVIITHAFIPPKTETRTSIETILWHHSERKRSGLFPQKKRSLCTTKIWSMTLCNHSHITAEWKWNLSSSVRLILMTLGSEKQEKQTGSERRVKRKPVCSTKYTHLHHPGGCSPSESSLLSCLCFSSDKTKRRRCSK